jgi:transcriptional regulator with XRE-family HTH domain
MTTMDPEGLSANAAALELRRWRLRHGLTQDEAAQLLRRLLPRFSRRTLEAWEGGDRRPNRRSEAAVRRLVAVTPDQARHLSPGPKEPAGRNPAVEALRAWREANGITQDELTRLLKPLLAGVLPRFSLRTLQSWESGVRQPKRPAEARIRQWLRRHRTPG